MMRHEQARHLIGPTENLHAVAVFTGAFHELCLERGVAAHGDGQVEILDLEEIVHDFAAFLFPGVDDEEHFPTLALARRQGGGGPFQCKLRAHWKSQRQHTALFHATIPNDLRRGFIGGDEQVAVRAIPRRAHGDGIGHDRDETKRALRMILVDVVNQMPIHRIRGDDAIRIRVAQNGGEAFAQFAHAIHLLAEQCGIVEHLKDTGPNGGRVLNDAEIRALGERVEHAVGRFEEIKHLDLGVVRREFDCVAKAAGGGIVAVAESGREYEYSLHGSPFREQCAPAALRTDVGGVKCYSHRKGLPVTSV